MGLIREVIPSLGNGCGKSRLKGAVEEDLFKLRTSDVSKQRSPWNKWQMDPAL